MKFTVGVPILFTLAAAIAPPPELLAQYRHPRYLSARSDLRRAVILMRLSDDPNVMRDMREAAGFVERAIREIDIAAAIDRRDLNDNPPVDTRLGRGSRFREILRLIDNARRDISQEEDNPRAREWRNRAFEALDNAVALVRKGRYDQLRDETAGAPPPPPTTRPAEFGGQRGAHPRYLRAISDLRTARAYLFRSEWRDQMRNQRAAVEEIDRAINAARNAAIDDGRNPDYAPPIDTRLGWGDRFTKAIELLNSAERDLSYAEDNREARGWRAEALASVLNAKRFVLRAQQERYWR